MLRNFVRPLEKCLGVRLVGGDMLMWQSELKPHATGDFSIAVVQANHIFEDQAQVVTSPNATFVGVYDGHGGPEASRFVSSRLFPHLQKFISEQGGLSSEVIRKAIKSTEEDFVHMVNGSWLTRPKIAAVGSCCIFGAISQDTLYVANLGDSRAVLGLRSPDGKKMITEALSNDHNVCREEVRNELKKLHPDDNEIVLHTRGAWRVKGIIQVSRSIGDVYLKNPELSKEPLFHQCVSHVVLNRPVLSAEPQIRVRKLTPRDKFVIFASDGLWENLSDEEAVKIVFNNPRSEIAKTLVKAALTVAAKRRAVRYKSLRNLKKGTRRYYHDDISAIVIYLDHRQTLNRTGQARLADSRYDYTRTPADIFSHSEEESRSSDPNNSRIRDPMWNLVPHQ